MEDVLTDLNGEAEVLPLSPPRDDWLGHKGMVQAAEYIRKKLLDEGIMSRAFAKVTFHILRALNANYCSRGVYQRLIKRNSWSYR